MKHQPRPNERGVALLFLLAIIALTSTVLFALAGRTDRLRGRFEEDYFRTKARYLAEAGIARAQDALAQEESPEFGNTLLGDGWYRVLFQIPESGVYLLQSSGVVEDARRREVTVVIEATLKPGSREGKKVVEVVSWNENPWQTHK